MNHLSHLSRPESNKHLNAFALNHVSHLNPAASPRFHRIKIWEIWIIWIPWIWIFWIRSIHVNYNESPKSPGFQSPESRDLCKYVNVYKLPTILWAITICSGPHPWITLNPLCLNNYHQITMNQNICVGNVLNYLNHNESTKTLGLNP